jgi:hypothetical protein
MDYSGGSESFGAAQADTGRNRSDRWRAINFYKHTTRSIVLINAASATRFVAALLLLFWAKLRSWTPFQWSGATNALDNAVNFVINKGNDRKATVNTREVVVFIRCIGLIKTARRYLAVALSKDYASN